MAIAGNDDGPLGAQPVPEERLAVERILRPINKRRPERHHRKPGLLMQAEQHPLRHRLIANVRIGMIVRRQRIAFVMIQSVAIRGHAGHENVARQRSPASLRRGFDLRRRGAALPVVDVVEDDFEAAAFERLRAPASGSLRSAIRFCTRRPRSCLGLRCRTVTSWPAFSSS